MLATKPRMVHLLKQTRPRTNHTGEQKGKNTYSPYVALWSGGGLRPPLFHACQGERDPTSIESHLSHGPKTISSRQKFSIFLYAYEK